MAIPERLKQLNREIGDLREHIGQQRARLESLDSLLKQRELEFEEVFEKTMNSLVVQKRPADPIGNAPHDRKVGKSGFRGRVTNGRLVQSIPARVVATLDDEPKREFPIATLAEKLGVSVHSLYGAMSRLTRNNKVKRVAEGVFRSKAGEATM